jgi:hypothetical protein
VRRVTSFVSDVHSYVISGESLPVFVPTRDNHSVSLPTPQTHFSILQLCAPGPPDCKCSVSEDGEYMSFGLSGHDTRSKMIGGDVVVAWVDKTTLKGYAYDYFLDSKSQCAGSRGSCPDERLRVICSLSPSDIL